jgi:hypothetical protein
MSDWYELNELMKEQRERDAQRPQRIRDTEPAPAPPPERWPTLVAIGLGDALDSIERVTAWAQNGKHKGAKWSTQTQEHQIGKLLGHIAKAMKGEQVDEDTGEHPYAHVAARSLMLLGLALIVPERATERCLVARMETGGDFYCTRDPGHTGPCAAWPR